MAFSSIETIIDFLEPVTDDIFYNEDEGFNVKQLGSYFSILLIKIIRTISSIRQIMSKTII